MKYNCIFLGYFLIFGLFSFNKEVQGQEQMSLQTRADLLFDKYEYHNAAQLYKKLNESKKIKTKNLERLAESYLLINNYDLAENWYARVIQRPDYDKQSLLNYATVLKQGGKYMEAKDIYNRYIQENGDDEYTRIAIQGADSAIRWMANPKSINIMPFSDVNTSLSEFSMIVTPTELIYVGEVEDPAVAKSGMTGNSFLKLLSRDIDGTGKGTILTDGAINSTKYHVGPVSSNKNGDHLFVTRTYSNKEPLTYKANGKKWSRSMLELMIYDKKGNEWREVGFPYNNVKEYSVGHAAWDEHNRRLYFASDMTGGLGGVDIWYSNLLEDGTWSTPVNAGAQINTKFDEMFPMLFEKKLYFSTDGRAGMGGLDIFEATIQGDRFINVKNMGFPINSPSDDFSYFVQDDNDDVRKGFLSSNRSGNAGGDDIYGYTTNKPVFKVLIEGKTYNKKSKELLSETTVTLFSQRRQIQAKTQSNAKAVFKFEADKNTTYKILAEHLGFYADSLQQITAIPTKDTVYQVALFLEPVMEVGHKFVLENIFYDFDKYNIRKDAAFILDQLVRTMRDNPTLRIELSSHTDSRGSYAYNDKLSQHRAESAVDYIVSRGIERSRLVAKGYGERRLVNKCSDGVNCTVAEHQANRRTEVEVLSY